jgi:ribose 5-phosphate isomerase B
MKSKKIGLACDHGGIELKIWLKEALLVAGYELIDFGAYELDKDDDFPDLIAPLAYAVSKGEVIRGIAVCGSGVGASIIANKIQGVRAALISDPFSARQGVEDDDMNVICLGGRVIGSSLALELVNIFLNASFKKTGRFVRRLEKIVKLESLSKVALSQPKA